VLARRTLNDSERDFDPSLRIVTCKARQYDIGSVLTNAGGFHGNGSERRFTGGGDFEVAEPAYGEGIRDGDPVLACLGDGAEGEQIGAAEQRGAAGQTRGEGAHGPTASRDGAGGGQDRGVDDPPAAGSGAFNDAALAGPGALVGRGEYGEGVVPAGEEILGRGGADGFVIEAHQHVNRVGRHIENLNDRDTGLGKHLPGCGAVRHTRDQQASGTTAEQTVHQLVLGAGVGIPGQREHYLVASLPQRRGEPVDQGCEHRMRNGPQRPSASGARRLRLPGLTITLALSFVQAFAVFPSAILLGEPAGTTRVMSIAAYQAAFEKYDYSMASAMAMPMAGVQIVIVLALLAARGLVYSSPAGGEG
jgi:hypothetical protein